MLLWLIFILFWLMFWFFFSSGWGCWLGGAFCRLKYGGRLACKRVILIGLVRLILFLVIHHPINVCATSILNPSLGDLFDVWLDVLRSNFKFSLEGRLVPFLYFLLWGENRGSVGNGNLSISTVHCGWLRLYVLEKCLLATDVKTMHFVFTNLFILLYLVCINGVDLAEESPTLLRHAHRCSFWHSVPLREALLEYGLALDLMTSQLLHFELLWACTSDYGLVLLQVICHRLD